MYNVTWIENPETRKMAEVELAGWQEDGRFPVPVLCSPELLAGAGMQIAMLAHRNDKPHIFIGDAFRSLPVDCCLAALWHEIGHIHFRHYDATGHLTIEERQQARQDAVLRGSLHPEEAQADVFAVSQGYGDGLQELLELSIDSLRRNGVDEDNLELRELVLRLGELNR